MSIGLYPVRYCTEECHLKLCSARMVEMNLTRALISFWDQRKERERKIVDTSSELITGSPV